MIDLAMMAHPHMLNAIILHGEPIVTNSHNLLDQQGSTSIGSEQALMHVLHQKVNLGSIYASKQGCIVVPLIQDFPIQEKLARHALDELLLIVCRPT